MSELIKRLRGYQESWWETIQRLDMGESDNGIMTTIRFEQHDTFKKAADLIEQQAERIRDLENRVLIERNDKLAYAKSNMTLAERIREFEAENDPQALTIAYMSGAADTRRKYVALAAQNEKLREVLTNLSEWSDPVLRDVCLDALALPDHSAHVLDMVRAKVLEEAADYFDDGPEECSEAKTLRRMAQELRSKK